MKTQNKKIAETDMNIWYCIYKKTVTRVRKKQWNESSHNNNM